MLSNEKLIKDYDIENNYDIILVKKEEQKEDSFPLQQNSDNSNNNVINKIKKFTDNKEINLNEVIKSFEQIQDILSYLDKVDLEKLDNFYMTMGLGKCTDIFRIKQQDLNEVLNL